MKNLFLVIKKEWYDKIKSGEKRVEYRAKSDYWRKRLSFEDIPVKDYDNYPSGNGFRYDTVEFQCGYGKKYPRLKFRITGISEIETPEDLRKFLGLECYEIEFK